MNLERNTTDNRDYPESLKQLIGQNYNRVHQDRYDIPPSGTGERKIIRYIWNNPINNFSLTLNCSQTVVFVCNQITTEPITYEITVKDENKNSIQNHYGIIYRISQVEELQYCDIERAVKLYLGTQNDKVDS